MVHSALQGLGYALSKHLFLSYFRVGSSPRSKMFGSFLLVQVNHFLIPHLFRTLQGMVVFRNMAHLLEWPVLRRWSCPGSLSMPFFLPSLQELAFT